MCSPDDYVNSINLVVGGEDTIEELCGLQGFLADVDARNFGIDPDQVARQITLGTRAIISTDHGGCPCDYAALSRISAEHNIPLIVDGGPTARSVATTIVDLSGGANSWMILREGAIPTHEIALALQR